MDMDKHGRKKDVIVNIIPRDPTNVGQWSPFGMIRSGKAHDEVDALEIWADKDMGDIIASVPGILNCEVMPVGVKYRCLVDPRYDTAFIAREVEAQILIGKPVNKPKRTALEDYAYKWRPFGGPGFMGVIDPGSDS